MTNTSTYHKIDYQAIVVLSYIVRMTGGIAAFNALSLKGSGNWLRNYTLPSAELSDTIFANDFSFILTCLLQDKGTKPIHKPLIG